MSHATLTATSSQESKKVHIFPIGFALFAMFFGAGNLVYPLALGVQSGQHLAYATLGFVVMGVGVPFLGLFATSLFAGDYVAFFERLGKVPAFLLITFLILIIGPLSAMPRTETVTYQTIRHLLPMNHWLFSALYCGIVFIFSYRESRMMDILGYVLSPVKLISFAALIILGVSLAYSPAMTTTTIMETVGNAIKTGYSTMDLLATFFFCSIAYHAIDQQLGKEASQAQRIKMTLKACAIGATCLALVYGGFMLISAAHANALNGVATSEIISAISELVLGRFGAIIVAVCITFACLSTAMALADVSSHYLHEQVFHGKVSMPVCLLGVVTIMFFMSSLGFSGIMAIAGPILTVIYPALIVLTVSNLLYKTVGFKYIKLPVAITLIVTLVMQFV